MRFLRVYFFFCILFILPAEKSLSDSRLSAGGTLILFVPTDNGLVAASDSRWNVDYGQNSTACDNAVKIIPLKRHERAVVAVSGTDKSFSVKGDTPSALCNYLLNTEPTLHISKIAANYLDSVASEITPDVFARLQNQILQKIRAVRKNGVTKLVNEENGRFCNVFFAHYAPERHVSTVASFVVQLTGSYGARIVDKPTWTVYQPSSAWAVQATGEGASALQSLITTGKPIELESYVRQYGKYKVGCGE